MDSTGIYVKSDILKCRKMVIIKIKACQSLLKYLPWFAIEYSYKKPAQSAFKYSFRGLYQVMVFYDVAPVLSLKGGSEICSE